MWFLTVLSIIGVILNVQKRRSGFMVWMVTNAGWFIIDLTAGLIEQAFLFLTYFFLAAWGWFKWRSV